jgi:hypothetical protein
MCRFSLNICVMQISVTICNMDFIYISLLSPEIQGD